MRHTEIDRQINSIAARQHGAFSRQQAFEMGASERLVQRRLKAGDWRRAVPAVYILATSPGSWQRQCKVAELSVAGSAVSGRSAAALHGLSGFRPGPIELLVPVNAYCRHPFATTHRYAGAQITTVDGFRVTTIAQTMFDLAARTNPWLLERALDDALLDKIVTVPQLEERLAFYEGSRRPGLPLIRSFVDERTQEGWTPPESELEALLLTVLERLPDRPHIVRQAQLPWRSARPGRVDVLLPDHRLIVEADGRRWHARTEDFDRDRWRDNEAVAHGYRVMRFTWVHLRDLPTSVLDLITRTIAAPATATAA